MLTTPFVKTQAYKFGFIDKNGKRITHKPDPKNPAVKLENKPFTATEKASYTPCLLYTSPSPRDQRGSRMPSSA